MLLGSERGRKTLEDLLKDRERDTFATAKTAETQKEALNRINEIFTVLVMPMKPKKIKNQDNVLTLF